MPRQDVQLKDVHEPSSNRKPMYFMLSMLCASHASPRARQPTPCAVPKALTSVGRPFRSANLVPVAEEQPAEEGTTRKEVRGRA